MPNESVIMEECTAIRMMCSYFVSESDSLILSFVVAIFIFFSSGWHGDGTNIRIPL